MMTVNWANNEYFHQLLCGDKRSHIALEMLVDDLHVEKDKTITKFLCHSGSEDFLWGLVKLLASENSRVAGNAAYIIGTLAENDIGCYRVLSLTNSSHAEGKKILPDLTRMLTFDDSESVMNAAGTMGTLAESQEGRAWMLQQPCLEMTIDHITALLTNENMWTASNAALVLARLTISEDGCMKILEHENGKDIAGKLINSLGVDEAGRGMNAAFAIGRLCDMDTGRTALLALPESEKMITALAKMLSCNDPGASKNACFALSCLATSNAGHSRILHNVYSDDILHTLSNLLAAEDGETGWFAAMTLRTLASQPKGCLRLREHADILPGLKWTEAKTDVNEDLKEEVLCTLEILKRLTKPPPPDIEVKGPDEVEATWTEMTTKSGLEVRYQLFEGNKCVYNGTELRCTVNDLLAATPYTFKLRAYTEGDDSPWSEPVRVITDESVPTPPQNFRILGSTTTQIKVGWEPPESANGHLKGYHVYLGKKEVDFVHELSCIISGLAPHTSYDISVCAVTVKGKGAKATLLGSTSELGAHAPPKPTVHVLGRNEIHVTWEAPEQPLGKITMYELKIDGKSVYSGMDMSYSARRLVPDKEYVFTVSAITFEGKCESKPAKARTSKDNYDSNRPPLYSVKKSGGEEQSESGSKQAGATKKRRSSKSDAMSVASSTEGSKSTKTRSTSANSAKQNIFNKWLFKNKLPVIIDPDKSPTLLKYYHKSPKARLDVKEKSQGSSRPSSAASSSSSLHKKVVSKQIEQGVEKAERDSSDHSSKSSGSSSKKELEPIVFAQDSQGHGNKHSKPKIKLQGTGDGPESTAVVGRPNSAKKEKAKEKTNIIKINLESMDSNLTTLKPVEKSPRSLTRSNSDVRENKPNVLQQEMLPNSADKASRIQHELSPNSVDRPLNRLSPPGRKLASLTDMGMSGVNKPFKRMPSQDKEEEEEEEDAGVGPMPDPSWVEITKK
ncbi:uncharacterized protein LOC106176403 isoform X2 [Lingula anatina]|uniref:Uncharacterized protein LOC106176403 isoform X2 n=1 Tax=Lingula anatina TaxID=7574 RepID=A0A1S3JV19_LINAN|nr:uncharacterized protein LOC106176403 isoform X2 [Lingula anatina]|eukprot:XP_013414225.1 uncharacterized protein LOC106176403 isoform X2 [Lingula anatina]